MKLQQPFLTILFSTLGLLLSSNIISQGQEPENQTITINNNTTYNISVGQILISGNKTDIAEFAEIGPKASKSYNLKKFDPIGYATLSTWKETKPKKLTQFAFDNNKTWSAAYETPEGNYIAITNFVISVTKSLAGEKVNPKFPAFGPTKYYNYVVTVTERTTTAQKPMNLLLTKIQKTKNIEQITLKNDSEYPVWISFVSPINNSQVRIDVAPGETKYANVNKEFNYAIAESTYHLALKENYPKNPAEQKIRKVSYGNKLNGELTYARGLSIKFDHPTDGGEVKVTISPN